MGRIESSNNIHDIETPREHKKPSVVTLHHHAVQRVNFASAQNKVPIIEELSVNNPTDTALTKVTITLKTYPPVIREKIWTIDRIAPGTHHRLLDLNTQLDIERLQGLDEAEDGELEFQMEAPELEETIVGTRPIQLLARDEWGGVEDMAQILAAFVSPNDPAVARVLKAAARLLEDNGHKGSLDGYQSGEPGRAYLLAGAIWSAATSLALTYAHPPASFEKEGQKIRGPSQIADEGLATCLDTTLFLAAAFEQTGLNPVVLFSQDHAWVGVWIVKRDFGAVKEPDVVAVRKAAQAREFVPIETTFLTDRQPDGQSVGFERAVEFGNRRLDENRDPEFVMAVDIARSRAARILPLASHRASDYYEPSPTHEVVPAPLPPVPDFGFLPSEISEEEPKTPQDRIYRWQRKLLDLTLHNRLLNYRDSKQTLPIRCPSSATLVSSLAAGAKFTGFSLQDNDPLRNRKVSPEEKQQIEEEVIREAFDSKQVVVPLTRQEMKSRFVALYRRARSDIQEGGTNTLFLVAGFLRWKKTEMDMSTYSAPLILIPVKLYRGSVNAPFRIARHEDEVRMNSTLLELLKRDFDLDVPELETDLPRNKSGIDIRLVFNIMRNKVRESTGFEVVEEHALSTFSFAKYLMWKDLVDRSDRLRKNRLIRNLIDGNIEMYGKEKSDPCLSTMGIDRQHLPCDLLSPLPADSSQIKAILAASKGNDMVVIGPPGTGKSQTITNIISQFLAEKKTVLFVAEKAAALDVVHRRLKSTGLGDSILELHSNKANRKSVLAQLGQAWERVSSASEERWIDVTEDLKCSRDHLNHYVEALHLKGTQGFSVFEAVALATKSEQTFKMSFPSKDAHNESDYGKLVNLAAELGRRYKLIRTGLPLILVRHEEYSLQWQTEFLQVIESLLNALDHLAKSQTELAHELGLCQDSELHAVRRERLRLLVPRVDNGAIDLSSVPEMPDDRLSELAEQLRSTIEKLEFAKARTNARYSLDKVRSMPLKQLDSDWRESQTKIWPVSAFKQWKVRKLLQTYATSGSADPATELLILFEIRKYDKEIHDNPLATVAQGDGQTDSTRAAEAVRQAVGLRLALKNLSTDIEDEARFEHATSTLASGPDGVIHRVLQAYSDAEDAVDDKIREYVCKGGRNPPRWSVVDFVKGLKAIVAGTARLPDWTKWNRIKTSCRATGLDSLVRALEAEEVEGENAEQAFKRAYAAWWIPLAMDASDDLRSFTRSDHEYVLGVFRKLDDDVMKMVPVEVSRRIAHGLPAKDRVSKRSELGILRHQMGLERPSLPIRQLLAGIPNQFGKLAPCVLMSPLSVA